MFTLSVVPLVRSLAKTRFPAIESIRRRRYFAAPSTAASGDTSSDLGDASSDLGDASSVTGVASSVPGVAPSVPGGAPSVPDGATSVPGGATSISGDPTSKTGDQTTSKTGNQTSKSGDQSSKPDGGGDANPKPGDTPLTKSFKSSFTTGFSEVLEAYTKFKTSADIAKTVWSVGGVVKGLDKEEIKKYINEIMNSDKTSVTKLSDILSLLDKMDGRVENIENDITTMKDGIGEMKEGIKKLVDCVNSSGGGKSSGDGGGKSSGDGESGSGSESDDEDEDGGTQSGLLSKRGVIVAVVRGVVSWLSSFFF